MKPWILLTLLFTLSPSARALDLSALGGLNYAAPTETTSGVIQTWTGNAAPTFGLAAALPLFDLPFSLESGVFFESASSDQIISSVDTTRETRWTQIPILLQFHFDSSVSIGAGGFVSFARGSVTTSTSSSSVNQDYSTAQIKDQDSGLLFNIRARFHVAPPLCILLDARYQHGLSNLSTLSANLQNTRSIQVLGGVSIEVF